MTRKEIIAALAAHDREIAAKALRDAADDFDSTAQWTMSNFLPGPNGDKTIKLAELAGPELRERADAIESGEVASSGESWSLYEVPNTAIDPALFGGGS